MARPRAPELTQRELDLMHVFWEGGTMTAVDARTELAKAGTDLAYTTVATLIKILVEKSFLKQIGTQRPFEYKPIRSFQDVSKSMVGDLVKRVFGGSREELLVQLLDGKRLTPKERQLLEQVLKEAKK